MNKFKKTTLVVVLGLLSCTVIVEAATWQKVHGGGTSNNTWQKIPTDSTTGKWNKLGSTGASGGPAYTFDYTISANTNNYNLRAAAAAAGWNQTSPLNAKITINPGVVVSSLSAAVPAFDTGPTFPNGTSLTLINNGIIRGKGGNGGAGGQNGPAGNGEDGGTALRAQYTLSLTNSGALEGGGGGGGGGSIWGIDPAFGYWSYSGGGGGVGGAGFGMGAPGGQTAGSAPNLFYVTSNSRHGAAGTNASATAAGTPYSVTIGSRGGRADGRGNDAAYNSNAGHGGLGGALGQAGGAGTLGNIDKLKTPIYHGPGQGGAGGAAIQGNSFITWVVTGSRVGSIN